MQIKVLDDRCIGAASCVAIAPGTFQLNDSNKAQVVDNNGDPSDNQLSAAQACPVNAIVILDDNGKQIWPPDNS